MINKNRIIFQGLVVIFFILSVFISVYALDNISVIFISLAIIVAYFLNEYWKIYKQQEEKRRFIEFTRNYMIKHNILGIFANPKKINADFLIFFPNKIFLIYTHPYQGDVIVNENIYDGNKKVLKNITSIKNNALIDYQLLMKEYEEFKAINLPYNPINIIPICYVHDANITVNVKHNILFANKHNIVQLLDHNILYDQSVYDVFPYDDFIFYLQQKNILSK